MTASTLELSDLARIVRAEFRESPGLRLTKAQVQRLWSLDPSTCNALLDALLATKFLRATHTGAYIRFDNGR